MTANSPRVDTAGNPAARRALQEQQFILDLHYAWAGQNARSRTLLADSAIDTLLDIETSLPGLTSRRASDLARRARDGAIAAALVENADVSRALFIHAGHFAAALVTGEEEQRADVEASLFPRGFYPTIRAYCLLRQGRLSDFHALLYTVPLPEGRNARPAWSPADIDTLLTSTEISIAIGTLKREAVASWAGVKGLIPVLRALSTSLMAPDSEGAGEDARIALKKYYSRIRNIADFHDIYPLVLDLQRTFPRTFGTVASSAL